jgi:DNA-directed RNA polymerase specialized sigma24 family protein
MLEVALKAAEIVSRQLAHKLPYWLSIEDAAQEGLLRWWASRGQWNGDLSSRATWTDRQVLWGVQDVIRQQWRTRPYLDLPGELPEASILAGYPLNLEGLTRQEQKVLRLTIAGMSQRRIAKRLKVTEGRVSQVVRRIKEKMI